MSKRAFDLLLTIPGLILLSPVLALIAVWIKADGSGPVFFRQTRVGLHGNLFQIIKFRTMVTDAEKKGLQLTTRDDSRVTKAGRFLRRTKLDELPQLFNVLVGEMSLVGPRPEVPKYVEYYPAEVKDLILSVRPGITDRASIEFRDENDMLKNSDDPEKTYIEEILPVKIGYYVAYAKRHTLCDDVRIIFLTLKKISH